MSMAGTMDWAIGYPRRGAIGYPGWGAIGYSMDWSICHAAGGTASCERRRSPPNQGYSAHRHQP